MKIPLSPPKFEKIVEDIMKYSLSFTRFIPKPVSDDGRYLHWDKLRHLQPPEGLATDKWWFNIKLARKALYKNLPFKDKYGMPFLFATPDEVLKKLHAIDRSLRNNIQSPILPNSQMRDTYWVRSLTEESITSSQLEGAPTTRNVAKEMLRTKRKPRDLGEQMIFNNYHAMQFILDNKKEQLTQEIILELHRILTKDTLQDNQDSGRLRTAKDNIHLFDHRDGEILHTPPQAKELGYRLKNLCQFANDPLDAEKYFMHPVIKAILLHFMLAYDHPFVDGNGRTARALFYWSMAQQGYWLMEFISISQVIKKSPTKYARAFLYTETDESDVTYFILHQLDVILDAINELYCYLDQQTQEINDVEKLLNINKMLQDKLNYRQIALIKHALKHPNMRYQIESHRQLHNVTYDTARTDLLNLAKLGLLIKQKTGKAFTFTVLPDLKLHIESL